MRNPRELAVLVLAIGLVVLAASEEPRGRWVPRTVAPLGLLAFFVVVLPNADARVRERIALEVGADGAPYLASVPSLLPRLRAWKAAPHARAVSLGRAAGATLAALAPVVATAVACTQRHRLEAALGF